MYNTKLGFYKALCLIELQCVFIKLWNGNSEKENLFLTQISRFNLIFKTKIGRYRLREG